MTTNRTTIKSISCDKAIVGTTKGKILHLRREGSIDRGGDYFKILRTVGEGGSCVCYEATLLGEKKTGRLREFYPLESGIGVTRSLERTDLNHLVATERDKVAFSASREEFVSSYHLLREVMEKNKSNADFTSFIPDFSIYYACDEAGDFIDGSTAYIWTAPENLTVFEDYIEDVHKHPATYPEHKLFTVLKTVLTLTECVKILHENGLLHLDIKPGNFGIPKRKGKLLTDSITLFDVNTIYSLKNTFVVEYGTEGFCAPEVARGRADNTSDIYSIGCTLFSALVVSDEVTGIGYSRQYYNKIPQYIDCSELITASETNSNVFLKNELSGILKRCLAESQSKRYQSCVELIRDLERALIYLYPSEFNAQLPIGKQLVVLEKELDKKRHVSAYSAFMYHLYKKPLYEFVPRECETLDVLVLGFGNYGQKFLDCCLQMGQVLGKRLNVKVISNDRAQGKRDKDIYLAARPALADFFCIDGSECKDPYGSIVFENREFVRGNLKKNKAIASEVVNEYNEGRYVFIALGDNSLNKGVAQAVVSATKGVRECSCNFVYDGRHIDGKLYGTPIYIADDITIEPLYEDMERMAFNVHLIWKSGLNIDYAKEYAKFKEPYYYNASLSNAIAIKYKLYSLGIPTDDLQAAADAYYRKILTAKTEIRDALIALEHRRWVCEKICDGWVCNKDLSSCTTAPHNDKKTKKHICIVRSGADAPLRTAAWTPEKWDNASAAELSRLDELDRVSVMVHRIYKGAADKLRRESPLQDATMLQLRDLVRKNEKTSIAFSEWYSCLTLLWLGNQSAVREYERLTDALTNALSVLKPEDINTAKVLIKLIDNRLDIILKSMRRVDYKNHDANLIRQIPFILTYKRNTHLVIPFACGCNTAMFGNVAAATVVNPAEITYVYHFNSINESGGFDDAVSYACHYMSAKTIASKLNFILSHRKDERLSQVVEQIKNRLKQMGSVQRVVCVEAKDDSDIARGIMHTLETKFRFDAAERNETSLSYLLVGAGFYGKCPHYQFHIDTKSFRTTFGCDFLRYIKAEQYLKISDMFASKNSKGLSESPAAFYNDYEALWQKVYRKKEFLWKKLCGLLAAHHKQADKLFGVNTDLAKEKDACIEYRFLIPSRAYRGARKLIERFTEAEIFEKSSEVYFYTTDSCEVHITAPRVIADKLKLLMADPYLLSQAEDLELIRTPYSINVCVDRLRVERFELKSAGKHAERIKELLRCLEDDFAFITGFEEDPADSMVVSFTYATKRIKKLLTNAGNILEVYIYHKCLKSGLFDDVATGYEINWEGTAVKSEFDIILTKGFGGLLIEAKATEEIAQDYYFKLSCLAKEFGTNCKSVLIADTVEKWFEDNTNNEMQRLRGNMLDVITISDAREIDNIDITLARLLQPKEKEESPFAEWAEAEEESAPGEEAKRSDFLPALAQAEVAPSPEVISAQAEAISVSGAAFDPQSQAAREAFLSQKISVLRIEQSQISVLQNYGVKTIADFLAQTPETFSEMKSKKGMAYTNCYLKLQEAMRKKLENL